MGMTAKFAVTGDMSQVDLPNRQKSGLAYALDVLDGVEGIGVIRMGASDVMRHGLVKKIITAFESAESKDDTRKKKEGGK